MATNQDDSAGETIFIPFDRMETRVSRERDSSDGEYFTCLLYYGEFLIKLTVAGLVAGIGDDPSRHQYRQAHRLVRASGIGDWVHALDDILTGPAAQYLLPAAREDAYAISNASAAGNWQHDAVAKLLTAAAVFVEGLDRLPPRVALRHWFDIFARLRNKTRGHGAPVAAQLSHASPPLYESIELIRNELTLFHRKWAFLHQNLSGKYRVSYLGAPSPLFEQLKSTRMYRYPNGIYIDFGTLCRAELVESDVDLSDFYCANGEFTENRYKLLSYITGNSIDGDSSLYTAPATELPAAETQGLGMLDVQGNCFGNLPATPSGYVRRPQLEANLKHCLGESDRYPIITLQGPGGIGKTSLALAVLHEITGGNRFNVIVWFSARDVELLPEGPKPVKRHVLNERDTAKEYVRLMGPKDAIAKGFDATKYLSQELTRPSTGPILFVFDNFETMSEPRELFRWLDTYVRLPNKILITTRLRVFNGDYQVEVGGMEESESGALIDASAQALGITHLLNEEYCAELHTESGGHPYVIKILLGEIAKEQRLVKPERIIADKDQLLTALFERTFWRLSPEARRLLLTLCRWRSVVPLMAVKAVLLRPQNDMIDVDKALTELEQSSLVDVSISKSDGQQFLSVPLAAFLFGQRKLKADPMRIAVEADFKFLQEFGATQQSDVPRGIEPRVQRLFSTVSERISKVRGNLPEYLPVLEFVAQSYPRAWLLLADLYEETQKPESARDAVRRFLEHDESESRREAWLRMANLSRGMGDTKGELHAWSEFAQVESARSEDISEAANRINSILRTHPAEVESEEKRALVYRVIDAFAHHIEELDATALSRLAWLCLQVGQEEKARFYTRKGMELDSENEHILKLAIRLFPS